MMCMDREFTREQDVFQISDKILMKACVSVSSTIGCD